jgi:AraC-like DNA-binding protein
VPGDILVFDEAAGLKVEVSDKQGAFHFMAFSVCFDNLLPLFACNEIAFLHNVAESFKIAKIHPAKTALASECHRLLALVPAEFGLDHRGQLIRIAATILSEEFKEQRNQKSRYLRTEDHMVEVIERLSSAEVINLSVGEMAGKFSCSRRHLNRLFHLHFGVSVASLKMEMRLLKAVSILRDPDVKVINVAEQCGFNHLGLFNTCFKRRFGLSPGRWRLSNNKPAVAVASEVPGQAHCPMQSNGLCPMNGPIRTNARATRLHFIGKITGGMPVAGDSRI